MRTPEELKVLHDPRQEGLAENEICIREGIVLKIQEESRFPFEFFTYRSPEMTEEMSLFIEYSKGRKCLLDIGALHGIFSMVFTEMNEGSKAYAFEPSPRAFDILRINASPLCKIRPFKRAISDGYGVLNMKEEWDHYVVSDKEENAFIVKCFSGDAFCEDIEPVDTIKIDVEGMELEVLKGLSKTINTNHPIIFLELHIDRLNKRDAIREIIDMIIDWRYKVIDSRTNKAISFEEIEKEKTGELRLILL